MMIMKERNIRNRKELNRHLKKTYELWHTHTADMYNIVPAPFIASLFLSKRQYFRNNYCGCLFKSDDPMERLSLHTIAFEDK